MSYGYALGSIPKTFGLVGYDFSLIVSISEFIVLYVKI